MRNNVKLLTPEQLNALNNRYRFKLVGDDVVVTVVGFKRTTYHDSKKSFHINSRIRKIVFCVEAIDFWKKQLETHNYSLIDIQQAYNALQLMYKKPNLNAICELVARNNFNIISEVEK